jgi:UDP-N-acetylglucosamine 2-epimerase (non-hydrolysing)
VKVLTILGTRPEIIRLSLTIEKLDRLCEHVVVHTGQNFDPELDAVFFQELGVRKPDHSLRARGSFGEQIATILAGIERVLVAEKPDRFLVLGDTNSSLGAIMAKRLGIPVYHMEAGNRCFDDRVPEEVNRRIIDHTSDILMPYTERSRQNLLREGIPGERIYVTGNPIYEVIRTFDAQIHESSILERLGLAAQEYFLATVHRAENVDVDERLRGLAAALDRLGSVYDLPIVVSTHPHTRQRMATAGIDPDNDRVRLLKPFGFFDFITLERNARCVLTDSGTVQEECAVFRTPNVTVRDVTERPETVECGSNILSGVDPDMVVRCVGIAVGREVDPAPPREYVVEHVSTTVANIVLGFFTESWK